MIVIAVLMFSCIWFLMFFYQFRSPSKYDGRIDMKEYAFCSNLIVAFSDILIRLLFFNNRLTKLPITIVGCQIINIGMFICFFVSKYFFDVNIDIQFLELKIWFGIFIIFLITIVVDHEIFCWRKKQ